MRNCNLSGAKSMECLTNGYNTTTGGLFAITENKYKDLVKTACAQSCDLVRGQTANMTVKFKTIESSVAIANCVG